MGFGPRMQFAVGDLNILMRPFKAEDAERFLIGMQSQGVIETLGLYTGQSFEDEQEFLERTRKDENAVIWAVCLVQEEYPDGLAIGTTSLDIKRQRQIASTGSVIFDRQWWGMGIATHCHKARTAFAFQQLGLLALESGFIQGNGGSYKALYRSGYEATGGFELRVKCIRGVWQPIVHLLCVNPIPGVWEYTWGGMAVREEFLAARERTLEALAWANSKVVEWPQPKRSYSSPID